MLKRYILIFLMFTVFFLGITGCTVNTFSETINSIENEIRDIGINIKKTPTEEMIQKYPQMTNLPTLYITLGEGDINLSSISKEEYISGTYTLVCDDVEESIYEDLLVIKGRGNYSWGLPKKPYAIKLAKERDLLGMPAARKWVLTANYSDKTLMRNYLTFNLAKDLGLNHTSECRYVDLYINGKYNGNYLMTESVQIYKNRINIDKYEQGLFEIEMAYRHHDHTECIEVKSGVHILYKEADADDISIDIRQQNLEKFREFFQTVDTSIKAGYEEYSKYIDVDSFINWYIVNEFVKNYDSGFTTSCYCYIDKDGKLYMGPVWDYDTCMGNQEVATCINPRGYHVSESPWYKTLTNDIDFSRLLSERWTELRIAGVFDNFVANIEKTVEYIAESERKDHKLWPDALRSSGLRGGKSKYTFREEVDYLTNWVQKRIDWLDVDWYN